MVIKNIEYITSLVPENSQLHLMNLSKGKSLGEVAQRLRVLATTYSKVKR